MAKWADYLISGIWKQTSGNSTYVSHVMVHLDDGESVGTGKKVNKDEVIRLLKNRTSFYTIKWNYSTASWNKGANVGYENRGGVEYLRTDPDAAVTDNIDNLIKMTSFGL